MNEMVTVEVTTQIFGLGGGKPTAPTWVALNEHTVTARALIAEHVRSEIAQAQQRRSSSLALHYMLADDLQAQPRAISPTLNCEREISRAWQGLKDRRYVLVVDGIAIDDLDTSISLTERSHVSFVRLLQLVGG